MTCAEFLERYTDFRDGLITAPRELRRFERHLARCAGCRRYDTAVRRGVLALQAVERIEPSRSEEHTSELQSQSNLVCRLLLEKKKKKERKRKNSEKNNKTE